MLALALLAVGAAADAATIWNGPRITFTKLRGQDATLPANQDRITSKVWLTRNDTRGLFNIRAESGYTATSPADTEWAFGTTADVPKLRFSTWVNFHGKCSPCQVGRDAVVHLVSEDIYIDIKILNWPGGTGNVTYERATPGLSGPTSTAVEYYHGGLDHYFVTAYAQEVSLLDSAATSGGWARTGQSYLVYPQPGAGLSPVCRFFSSAFAPRSSHFYTADAAECAQLKSNGLWQYEADAFFVDRPVAGECPPGSSELHRLYNNGKGGAPNHRYTSCALVRDHTMQRGWVYEGVTMCVARSSADCSIDLSLGTVPGAPTLLSATPGDANVTIGFSAPASQGGSPISLYTARCIAAGVTRTGSNTASPVAVRGLANGIRQSCTVVATNFMGDGPASDPVLVTPAASVGRSYNPLVIPPLATPSTATGILTYELTLAPSTMRFLPGVATATYSYNDLGFWGPTLLMNRGDTVRMRVKNNLAEEATTHWHGLLLPGASDGGPHSVIAAGAAWLTGTFTVRNNASTYWYHPHRHETTQKQLTLGAGGFIIVRDPEEGALALPRTYGVDDIPLAFTSRRFATVNGVANQFVVSDIAYGDMVLANGTMNAQITLPRQLVRLRVLNAEVERELNLGFNDGRIFHVIGNDGGLLSVPVAVTNLVMAPGERYELLVNLTGDLVGTAIDLEAHNGTDAGLADGFAGYEDATGGPAGSLLNRRTFTLLHINVGPATADAVIVVPAKLAGNAGLAGLTAGNATVSRTLAITGGADNGPFAFNELPFDMERIDQAVTLDATESWTVGAGTVTSHSFHIHGVQFRIVARNGSASEVKAWEQGWKDTFYLPVKESVTFVARFQDTADAAHPYMYHCHMINHEDEGLMGQFTVK